MKPKYSTKSSNKIKANTYYNIVEEDLPHSELEDWMYRERINGISNF